MYLAFKNQNTHGLEGGAARNGAWDLMCQLNFVLLQPNISLLFSPQDKGWSRPKHAQTGSEKLHGVSLPTLWGLASGKPPWPMVSATHFPDTADGPSSLLWTCAHTDT